MNEIEESIISLCPSLNISLYNFRAKSLRCAAINQLHLRMVPLPEIHESNDRIPSSLPKTLVAVFAGATSGIGEATLKNLVKYAIEPKIYLLARNPVSAARVIAECRRINPKGEYVFIKADLSLVKETDHACAQVKTSEKLVNLVVLSAGEISFDRGRKCDIIPHGGCAPIGS